MRNARADFGAAFRASFFVALARGAWAGSARFSSATEKQCSK
jgi:hypothetical protein